MPASDYDARLVSEVHLSGEPGRWHVYVRYGERRYQLGTWVLYADAHRACSASALEKALGSPDKRAAKREVPDGILQVRHSASSEQPMSQEQLAHLVHEQTAAIAALERRISAHEAIRRILRVLALEEITVSQAIGILAETAERSADPEQRELYQQAMDTLRQMQAEEP